MTGRLAIVDDDVAFTEYVETRLRAGGYDVAVFHSGKALLDALHSGLAPSVILLDVSMPDLNGMDTLRAVRSAQPGAQVIMLSGARAPATIVEAVRLGAADYVLKPGDAAGLGEAALDAAIRNAFERDSMASELAKLRASAPDDPEGLQPYWTPGSPMRAVMAMVERIAESDVDVLLRGESGVGKDVIAREVHRRSSRRQKPFVKVNCAALPGELLESELFGHERGAFTGASSSRVGKFEFAQHGTIMLDEIGEMPVALQAKLLHVLQDRQFTRLGNNRMVDVDVRVIAATNRDLEEMIVQRAFREDLYYRLQAIEVLVPPLRDRRDEIPALVEFFLTKYSRLYQRPPKRPSATLMENLIAHPWPGNIRELENTIKRLVVLQDETFVLADVMRGVTAHAPRTQSRVPTPAPPAEVSEPAHHARRQAEPDRTGHTVDLLALARSAAAQAEHDAITDALTRFRWNRRKAAQYLSVSYKTLLNKMKDSGIHDSTANDPPS